jgi:hypothetical protein
MWTTTGIIARTLVWLVAMSVTLQSMPEVGCGCSSAACSPQASCFTGGSDVLVVTSCCGERSTGCCPCTGAAVCQCSEGGSCCSRSSACCDSKNAKSSCCSTAQGTDSQGCQCGDNCQCGIQQLPAAPMAPPAESNSLEKVTSDSLVTASLGTIYVPTTVQHRGEHSATAPANAALDRCISLCRFTL